MNPLRDTDVEEQISLVHFQAVCAHARMCKSEVTRLEDNAGIDAKVTAWFPPQDDHLEEVDFKVQLKATIIPPKQTDTHFSYSLKKEHYDLLRKTRLTNARILIVLFLPPLFDDWLIHSPDQLALRGSAYWVSLRGAPACGNASSQTVYLPRNQPFNTQTIQDLAARLARLDYPLYEKP